jgi:Holliday junction resolvase RusA-like endonuclease
MSDDGQKKFKRRPTKKVNGNRTSNSNAILESNPSNASNGKKRIERFYTPVRIVFTHYRNRLIDPDNLSVKAVLDQLVSSKILADDSSKQIQEITHRQIKTRGEEKTVVLIEEI